MSSLLFRRQVLLEVAGFEIRNLKISFNVDRQVETPPQCTINVFNLSDDSERRIRDRGKQAKLDAGYPDTIGTIFEGAVDRVNLLRQPPVRITRLECGGKADAGTGSGSGGEAPNANGVVRMRSYPKGTHIVAIAQDFIDELGLMSDESLTLIPAAKTLERAGGWVWTLGPGIGLSHCLQLEGLSLGWTEVDGVAVIGPRRTAGEAAAGTGSNPNEGLDSGAEEIDLSAASGMIGSPFQAEADKAECAMLLNPLIRIGTIINIDSEVMQGRWRVSGLRHVGDNWTAQFVSHCDLRSIT